MVRRSETQRIRGSRSRSAQAQSQAARAAPRGKSTKTTSRPGLLRTAVRGAATILAVLILPRRRAKGNYYRYKHANPVLALVRVVVQFAVVAILIWWLVSRFAAPAAQHAGPSHVTLYVPPHGPLRVDGGPTISPERLDGILAAYQSPLQGHGQDILALSSKYKIDDAVALAFFVMESRAGTQGEAVATHNFGNLRPMPNEPARDGYRYYDSWIDGAAEWFHLMSDLYVNQLKLHKVADIIPVYAPSSDSNDPASMTAGIEQLVACWRGAVGRCPADPAAVPTVIASIR